VKRTPLPCLGLFSTAAVVLADGLWSVQCVLTPRACLQLHLFLSSQEADYMRGQNKEYSSPCLFQNTLNALMSAGGFLSGCQTGSRGLLVICHFLVLGSARADYVNYRYLKHWEVSVLNFQTSVLFAERKLLTRLCRRLSSALPAAAPGPAAS